MRTDSKSVAGIDQMILFDFVKHERQKIDLDEIAFESARRNPVETGMPRLFLANRPNARIKELQKDGILEARREVFYSSVVQEQLSSL